MQLVFCATEVHSQFVWLDPACKYKQDKGVSVQNELCFYSPLDQLDEPWEPISILQGAWVLKKAIFWVRNFDAILT